MNILSLTKLIILAYTYFMIFVCLHKFLSFALRVFSRVCSTVSSRVSSRVSLIESSRVSSRLYPKEHPQ